MNTPFDIIGARQGGQYRQPVMARCARVVIAVLLFALLAACTSAPETPAGAHKLTVMTHDSFAATEALITAFEQEHNVEVAILPSGDAGTALNKAILAKNNPIADVFYGMDNTFLSRGLDEGIFERYDSPLLANIPQQFKLDSSNRALPVDYGDVCLNYDIAALAARQLPPPQNLADLLDPAYNGLTVVENPATSSPGLAFLLATIAQYGDPGYLEYWKALRGNDVLVVNDWNTAYYTEFSRSGGTRPIVLSYNSSPAFELIYAEPPGAGTPAPNTPPTAAVTGPGSCFRQVEFAGILKGTPNRELAEKWIDFMLSKSFQEDLPLQMFVFPVNTEAQLDAAFTQHLSNPQQPAALDPQEIAANREKWLQAWTEAVLR